VLPLTSFNGRSGRAVFPLRRPPPPPPAPFFSLSAPSPPGFFPPPRAGPGQIASPPSPSPTSGCVHFFRGPRSPAAVAGSGWLWVRVAMASVQNVVVMRHGDRIDAEEPLWERRAQRPWDPPLTEAGKARAWTTGTQLRAAQVGFPIHRVLVSPFLRCLETAREVVSALCADGDERGLVAMESGRNVPINTSGLKVSIEYGLSEVFSRQAIDSVPKDGNWFPSVTELEAAFPPDVVDHSAEPVYQQLPHWEEPVDGARQRYQDVILALSDKYASENLLLVTHGEAIGVAVSSFLEGVEVFNVDFCAYSHLQREVNFKDSKTLTAGDFKMLTDNGKTVI
ncbi:hypothetical protein Taro_038079, partial [Colocasia esculenta]|nr:hypothetical protein [Colocasia esculenta]